MMGILFILWAEPAWPLRDKCLTVNAESSAEMVCVSECQRINGDSRTLLAPFRQMQCYSDLVIPTPTLLLRALPPPASSDAAAFSNPPSRAGLEAWLGSWAAAAPPRPSRSTPGTLGLPGTCQDNPRHLDLDLADEGR
ncbi:LOW QUALITY PROTEIN: hypothetical protein H101_02212 [Trichophyton interdigitale H6]|nr:LOW QUALITY PROTEIN: hypothetical protein H101_02212 [Trichophyton interdigitale H6]